MKALLKNKFTTILIMALFSTLLAKAQVQPLTTVANVELNKYLGKWYEIASFPQSFQKGCNCTTANYILSNKGYVIVENRCNIDSVNGKEKLTKGKAFVVKGSNNAKLKVQFFWPFKGKYWIIDLADDYSYAVVSHPNRKYLWILSRTPQIDAKVYDGIIERLKEKQLDVSKLVVTKQKQLVTQKNQLYCKPTTN